MNNFLVKILRWKLRKLAQLAIARFRPGIVGVTGSVGKTSTKLAIRAVLGGGGRRVRASAGNLNNDLGFPLTILGDWSEEELRLVSRDQPSHTKRVRKLFFWLKVVTISFFRLLFGSANNYPEVLVLEYGADRPGDIKYLLGIARPSIAVITAIGDIPVHVEFFAGPEELAREKGRLIEQLPTAGFAVLNLDDDAVMELKERTRAHTITFGFDKNSSLAISRFENRTEGGYRRGEEKRPAGIAFKLEHAGNIVPVRIDGSFGKVHAYASAAAAAVGLAFGMNLVKISEALRANYKPAHSRMELLAGMEQTYVIDDSYNASPLSMHAALDTLKELPGKRKIAVLGDMLEIGKYAIEAHERVGRLAGKFLDILITVGPRAKFIAEAAREAGMKRGNIFSFDTMEEAQKFAPEIIKKGDLILIKGSHAMELDNVVEEIRAF